MNDEKLDPVHPGEVLLEEYLTPMGLSQNRLAVDIRVPPRRINEIVQGKRRITADTALRLAHYFNMSDKFWLGLQMDYDLDIAMDEIGPRIAREVITYAVSAPATAVLHDASETLYPAVATTKVDAEI